MNVTPLAPAELRLETDRLVLQPLQAADQPLVEALITDERVMQFLDEVMTVEDAGPETARHVQRGAGGRIGVWSVTRKRDDEKIGTAILLPLPVEQTDTDWSQVREDRFPEGKVEVGYMFRPMAWGQGYATEACTRMLRFGFERTGLNEFVAVTEQRHTKSQHVLVKSGLKASGTTFAYQEECAYFRVTRAEWLEDNRE